MKKTSLSWIGLYGVTFLAAYLFILNEWLFAITKPSFFNHLAFPRQLDIFLFVSALVATLCFLGLLPLVLLSLLPPLKKYKNILIKLGGLLPAAIFATLILMLIDNFTYTIFRWGVVSTEGWSRALYGFGFLGIFIWCTWRVFHTLEGASQLANIICLAPKVFLGLIITVMLLSLSALVPPNRLRISSTPTTNAPDAGRRPHILLITSDGLSAGHMSVYGYARDTTPRLRELAESSLVAENAFPNSGKSTGSVISTYTSKYPVETQVLLPPDILMGRDAYEHLPGILHAQGYRTIQITAPYYLDANCLNVLEGFDEVKTTTGVYYSKYINLISKILPADKALFVDEILKRVVDRIRHIFFIQRMANPYLMVTRTSEPLLDMERLEIVKNEIRTSKQPVFIHIHLMVTHGPKYKVIEQKYSAGQRTEMQALWTDDFYDDSILEMDKNLGDLIDYLSDLHLLENTIVIIGSDHAQRWVPVERIPLIIRFPLGQYGGSIQANVQNLDIAPTILDYMGIDQPQWMRGRSLIAGDLEQRPIFGLTAYDPEDFEEDNTALSFTDSAFSTLIHCQRWHKLGFPSGVWETGFVEGSTAACPPGSDLTEEQAVEQILNHFEESEFDLDHVLSGSD